MLRDWESLLLGGGARQAARLPIILITAAVVTVVCLAELRNIPWLQRLEQMTYDGRVWLANHSAGFHPPPAPNLGLVVITDDTVDMVQDGTLGYRHGLLWPRSVYARALQELSRQGAGMAGFDVVFDSRRPFDPPIVLDGRTNGSDEFFAETLKKAGNAVLAAEHHVAPDPLFQDSAADLGNIYVQRDEDGVLRRDRPYEIYRIWDPLFKKAAPDTIWIWRM